MCGIIAVATDTPFIISNIVNSNAARGQDGTGFSIVKRRKFKFLRPKRYREKVPGQCVVPPPGLALYPGTFIMNLRAEPTTEAVIAPTDADQQPYFEGQWAIVHNGVIANDKQLIEQYNLEPTTRIDSWVIAGLLDVLERVHLAGSSPQAIFEYAVSLLEGSFSIFATHTKDDTKRIYYATNYRPLYYAEAPGACVVCSVKHNAEYKPVLPYSIGYITPSGVEVTGDLYSDAVLDNPKALVVLSGGLDSTVAAAILIDQGLEVEFLHFNYGCRATDNELKAVRAIATHYDRPLRIVNLHNLFTEVIGNSRLVDPDAQFADTVTGAEQAIEWVPARNTILASIAIGIAEANGIGTIALGINNEESGGGYTDNVLDLYQGFNDLNQWIVGANKRVEFTWPVGSMMKRHIVAEGLRLQAPLHLTWSCYNTGNQHCGKCGPCFMRKTAFEINNAQDPVFICEEL